MIVTMPIEPEPTCALTTAQAIADYMADPDAFLREVRTAFRILDLEMLPIMVGNQ